MWTTLSKIVHYFEDNSALLEAFLKSWGARAPLAPVEETPMETIMIYMKKIFYKP